MLVHQRFNWKENKLEVTIDGLDSIDCHIITVELVPWFGSWKLKEVNFDNDFGGLSKAVSNLACGIDIGDAIQKLQGVKPYPDLLAQGLQQIKSVRECLNLRETIREDMGDEIVL